MAPRILLEEHVNGLTLTIGQEWPGAGLYWRWTSDHWTPIGRLDTRSSGRFYQDQHGEIIHGRTLSDVVQHARVCAFRWIHGT